MGSMDPLTHALTSYALARAVLPKPARTTILLVVVAGVAPDLDALGHLAGPSTGLRLGGALTHSLLGAGTLAVALAVFYSVWKRKRGSEGRPLLEALGLVTLGITSHLLFDVASSYGVALLWPFRSERTAWSFMLPLDPILLGVLLFTLLLPGLFRLVSEEIGARTERRVGRWWAVAAVAALALLGSVRFFLHERALTLLGASRYHERAPLHVGAFADSTSPFHWLGVVETEASIEEVEVPMSSGAEFNPQRSRTYFKPDASPVLDAARQAPTAAQFLALARFPNASVERTAEGWRVELRDVGFSPLHDTRGYYFAEVELDAQARVVREELAYTRQRSR
jgi:membrane-bound metal-dependent hydrolase YbcI (DUF457 family)